MFYRLHAAFNTAVRLDVTPVNRRVDAYLDSKDFELKFEKIDVDLDWPHCELFRAPKVDEDQRSGNYQFPEGKEIQWIPDVWAQGEEAIVSDTVRRVIDEFDDFDHQFWPTSFLDFHGNIVNDQPYYHLNIRRILEIEGLGLPMEPVDFSPSDDEKVFLPTVQHRPVLREKIETLPLWRHSWLRQVLYLNKAMVDRLRAAGVTGMDEIKKKYHVDEECLGHV